MKTILLVRHSKTSNTSGSGSDFDRPLTDRGFREAAEMGKKLFKTKIAIDQFVSSPALRAKTTAELFASEYDRKLKEILYIPSLYNADRENFADAIAGLNDKYDHVALFSHNPGITDFAASLTVKHIDHMPTSSVFAVTAPIDYWNLFALAEKSFLFFYEPE